ncbi:Spatacsin [Frankliniella fusca]|uniref:Spatacsin n=1 Tax=Frankliniella fusca TaxID=407009 RepID=A0AAE1H9S1_9NEOP|nr:Spatacsin [Frankliniella fusca]
MIPLPQLLDGLSRGRLEVLQNALTSHRKAFRSEFVRFLVGGVTTLAEEHVARMAVLFETILNHLKTCDKSSPFSNNVLKLTIDHINEVIVELEVVKLAANSISIQQKNAVLELLHFNLNILKNLTKDFITHQSLPAKKQVFPVAQRYGSTNASSSLSSVSSKSDEEVVQQALLNYDSLVFAKELLSSRGQRSASEVNEFVQSVADAYIIELLKKKQIEVAKDVIYNTNRDIWQSLKNICLETVDSSIRDYIAFELNSIGLLEPAEIDTWKFLILIEGVIKGTEISVRLSEARFKIQTVNNEGNQMEISLSALLNLPSIASVKTPLLIDLYFRTSNRTLESMLDKENCWSYLLCSNQVGKLIKWIDAACSEYTGLKQLDRLSTFLSSWNLTQSMIDEIQKCGCSIRTQETVLDYLSKYGLYSIEESQNIQKVLLRAVRTSQVFNISKPNFIENFVKFCLDSSIPDLLVSCDIMTESQTSPLLKLYSKFQALKDKPLSKRSLCDCIKYCANYLNLPETQQWISLAYLLLADKTVKEALNEIPALENDDQLNARTILSQHPQLEYFLTSGAKKSYSQDITLLNLLKQRFSSTSNYSILKHQSLSSMFKDESEISEIDFSHEPTILLYGHPETLDFKYYLKQGRPCHASMLFFSDAIKSFGRPSRKLMKKAVFSSHELAYQNASNQMITASCIAFLEILGESSFGLRTHLATIHQINSILASSKNCSDSIEFQFLFTSEEKPSHPLEVYDLLQSSLPLDLFMQGLAVQFANLHKLPLPRRFLKHCGQRNDWINFLLFCQIYCYPTYIVKASVKYFESSALKEHLSSFLSRSSKASSDSARQRSGARFLPNDTPGVKDLEQLSFAVQGSPPIPTAILNSCTRDSLFGALLAAHNCTDPVEALLHMCVELPCPVLAVLADFYQVNAEAQLVAWLASWFSKEERVDYECWQQNEPWPPYMVELLLLKSLEISCTNLLTGFQIFMPEHPLVFLLNMLDGLLSQNKTTNEKSLMLFRDSCTTLDSRNGQWSLSQSTFVIDIGRKLIIRALECLPFISHKIRLLEMVSSANFSLDLEGFDWLKLLSVFNILEPLGVDIDVKNYVRDSALEIKRCSEKLLELELYGEAAALSEKSFLIEEQTSKFHRSMNSKYPDMREFFKDCSSSFEKCNIEPFAAFNFFQKCSLDLIKNEDRWRAMYHAREWLKRSVADSPDIDRTDLVVETELELWRWCLCDNSKIIFQVLTEELHSSPLNMLCTKELARSFKFSDQFHKCNETCKTLNCSSHLLDCLLDIGDLIAASHVQKLIQLNHQDFEILEACINLVEEKISEKDIPLEWGKKFGLNFDSNDHPLVCDLTVDQIETPEQVFSHERKTGISGDSLSKRTRILTLIQTLCKRLQHGSETGKQLVSCYRLSINLGLSYNEIILVNDPLKLLRSAVSQNSRGDYSVAADIMVALRMSPQERSMFLSREIIAAISKGPPPGSAKVFLLWGHDLEQHFRHILELVPDPSLLGNELMIMVSKLSILEKHTPRAVLNTAVELLVRAHDCYAASCHMEGITQVLRTVSSFAAVLKSRSEWALLVRLLTGIQRYTEMKYIFKILKESDHFEFLLRKDSFKPLSFKIALLDWLQRECPDDTELLKMTAAHFAMHEQEAALWQKEGNSCINNIVQSGLQNNAKTKQGLQTAMEDFSHAAECYIQADMLNHAMTCAHQAELIALQIFLLSSTLTGTILRVLMLDSKSVARLIVSTLSFSQALIVARAYNHRADWAAALFYHCVSPGLSCKEYFHAWSSCMELTPSIVQSIAYRLQRTSAVTREMNANMKWLLGHVKDMDVRYKIASELGLKDMVESLLDAPEVAYLKDTVWQSGFKK